MCTQRSTSRLIKRAFLEEHGSLSGQSFAKHPGKGAGKGKRAVSGGGSPEWEVTEKERLRSLLKEVLARSSRRGSAAAHLIKLNFSRKTSVRTEDAPGTSGGGHAVLSGFRPLPPSSLPRVWHAAASG